MRPRIWLLAALCACLSCAGTLASTPRPVGELRASARSSSDGEVVGLWALSEMLAPGGSADQATLARQRLDAVAHDGMWASLARAVIDEARGDPQSAAGSYVRVLVAASQSNEQQAPQLRQSAAASGDLDAMRSLLVVNSCTPLPVTRLFS